MDHGPHAGGMEAPDDIGIYFPRLLTNLGRSPQGANTAPRQTGYAAARGSVVVWLDTSSTELNSGDWRVYARDTRWARSRVLGDSDSDVGGFFHPWPPGSSQPTIGTSYVAWAISRPAAEEKPAFRSDIVGRRPDGVGRLFTLVKHAKMPAFRGADLYYVRSYDVDPTLPAARYEIRKHRMDGTDELVVGGHLGKNQMINKLAVSPHRLAWVVGTAGKESGTLYVRGANGSTTAFSLKDSSFETMQLSVADAALAWGNGSGNGDPGEYVFSFRRNRLWRVDAGYRGFSSAMAAGDFVAWAVVDHSSRYPRFVVAKVK